MMTLGEVENYQQIAPYSCGAAALKAVLKNYGSDYDERMLIKLVGVDPKSGSSAFQVASAARRLGYEAQPFSFDSVDELATYTENDIPVIVAIRSFTRPDQGHFVVATEVDDDYVYVMDPNVRGNRRTLKRDELDRRWQFRDRTGIIITTGSLGRTSKPRTKRRRSGRFEYTTERQLNGECPTGFMDSSWGCTRRLPVREQMNGIFGDGESKNKLGWVLLGAGAVAAITTTVLLVRRHRASTE